MRSFCLAVLVLAARAASGDTVIGTGSFVPVPVLGSNTGQAFWNSPSLDGNYMNVGYFLTGTGGFPAACGANALCGTNYLGNAGQYYSAGPKVPDDPSDFSFLRTSTAVQITVLGAFAGKNTAGNVWSGNMPTTIGYYDASATTEADAAASEVTLWSPGGIPGAVGTTLPLIPIYSNYGFYETVCTQTVLTSGGYQCVATATFFSNSNLNPVGQTAFQHFALFSLSTNSDTYFIGFEDLPANSTIEGLGDYNDVVLELASGSGGGSGSPITTGLLGSTVPEPGTLLLVGIGLLGVGGFLARRSP
ncbi:MAG: DUF4114 domain-containing protein [Bryobacterales bacterium]|nr:DUF4114 domain-containing protein [Bryobacterales bacterium]MBV9397707.1 DUF4114 domain-containing protein [Bryobacterales bacterium]